jgi:hypothetical protein
LRNLLFIIFLVPVCALSQVIDRSEAEAFIRALLWNRSSLESWFDQGNLTVSHRLGIEYDGVTNKNLIAYDVDDTVKGLVREGRLGYTFMIDTLDGQYARLILKIDGANGAKEFYFRGKRSVSPLEYFARNWTMLESEHFRFFLSDSALFNTYSREQLEFFVARMAVLLGLNNQDMGTLREKKIYYYLCKDEDEIQKLTGFQVRGMFNLAYDAVVTTYNAHYHELLHLLVNYKLRHLPLYTLSFLQEGFAVAYGGRGGLESAVLLPVGRFLFDSHYVELPYLLDMEGFMEVDASISYPAAGLYNKFLIETIGIQPYLRLYRAHSWSPGNQPGLRISPDELPDESKWISYLQGLAARNSITLDSLSTRGEVIFADSTVQISKDSEKYYFILSGVVLLPGIDSFPSYQSKAFKDVFPGKAYRGDKYMIRASAEEISVYNLFTNNLIGSYAASFSSPPKSVPRFGDRYSFAIMRGVFDEPFCPVPRAGKQVINIHH